MYFVYFWTFQNLMRGSLPVLLCPLSGLESVCPMSGSPISDQLKSDIGWQVPLSPRESDHAASDELCIQALIFCLADKLLLLSCVIILLFGTYSAVARVSNSLDLNMCQPARRVTLWLCSWPKAAVIAVWSEQMLIFDLNQSQIEKFSPWWTDKQTFILWDRPSGTKITVNLN